MEYKVTINDDATAKLALTYTPEDIEDAFKKAYIRASQKVKVNGFRQGKAPIEMVIKMLGDTVSDDAVTILLTDSINGLYPTLSFKAYKPPKIEIEKFERHSTLIAKATYETAPEIHLGKYKELEVEVYDVKITDEDIAAQLKDIQLKLSTDFDCTTITNCLLLAKFYLIFDLPIPLHYRLHESENFQM